MLNFNKEYDAVLGIAYLIWGGILVAHEKPYAWIMFLGALMFFLTYLIKQKRGE